MIEKRTYRIHSSRVKVIHKAERNPENGALELQAIRGLEVDLIPVGRFAKTISIVVYGADPGDLREKDIELNFEPVEHMELAKSGVIGMVGEMGR